MIEVKKQHVRIVSIIIAVIFVGSVVALALTQSGSGIASAAGSSTVGVVDYRQVMNEHPQLSEANNAMQQAVADAKKDFDEKSVSMGEQEKAEYYQQTQQRLQQKQQELIEPIEKSVEDAVKNVANAKGLNVVLEKNTVVYGGQDITQDVIKKLAKK